MKRHLMEAAQALPISNILPLIFSKGYGIENATFRPLHGVLRWSVSAPGRNEINWVFKGDVFSLYAITEEGVFTQEIKVGWRGRKGRYLWQCPGCGRWVAILYLPPGERAFLCKNCHGLIRYREVATLDERREYWYFQAFSALHDCLEAKDFEEEREAYRRFIKAAGKAMRYEFESELLRAALGVIEIALELLMIALGQEGETSEG
jgi:hypothetical protein